MWHFASAFVLALLIGSRRRPWWQAGLLAIPIVPLHWSHFLAIRGRLGLETSDPNGRLVVLVAVHLIVISAGWALGRWINARGRVRID